MKTIGLLGGMSPESTVDYYRRINRGVGQSLGAHHGAEILIHSVDLQRIFDWLASGDLETLGDHLTRAARGLERAGADFVLMACNTTHLVADTIEAGLSVPFVHITDVLGGALRHAGHRRVGLLGSRVTLESPFYTERLRRGFGVEAVLPSTEETNEIDRIIREELCFDDIRPASRSALDRICRSLAERGAEAIALACTELGLLVGGRSVAGLPIFDTTALHCQRTVALALVPSERRHIVAA